MTRKDYQLIADVIRRVPAEGSAEDYKRAIVSNLSVELWNDNARFDFDRFRIAALAKPEAVA